MAEILVVDDDESLRVELHDALSNAGFDVEMAVDGKDALDKFNSDDALKMVIADLHMPKMDGLELAVYIRDSKRSIPVMLLTTETNPELIYQGNLAEIERWLVKPFNKQAIVDGIKVVMH